MLTRLQISSAVSPVCTGFTCAWCGNGAEWTDAPAHVFSGILSDRIGKRAILVIAAMVQIWCPFVQAYTRSFTVAIFVACYCGLTGGLFGGPIQALQADALPADENGESPYTGSGCAEAFRVTGSCMYVPSKMTRCICIVMTGVPLNASRDVNLIGLAWVLPGLILPMGLAHMFKLFSDPYRIFFLTAGVLITIQSPMLFGVHPRLTSR